jgi:hypothetical protein
VKPCTYAIGTHFQWLCTKRLNNQCLKHSLIIYQESEGQPFSATGCDSSLGISWIFYFNPSRTIKSSTTDTF